MVKSFFDPQWMDIGILGVYGRWLEVNWVWTEMLIIYHAVFSITIPIVISELAYPERRNESWVGAKTFKALIILLIGVTAFGYFALTAYRPPLPQYLAATVAMVLFAYAGYKLPAPSKESAKKNAKSFRLWLIGLASTTAFFLLSWAGPYLISEPIAIMALEAILVLGMVRLLSRYDWESPVLARARLAIVAGALSFLIFLAPLTETDPTRKDNPAGMTLVALATIVFLLFLWRKLKKQA